MICETVYFNKKIGHLLKYLDCVNKYQIFVCVWINVLIRHLRGDNSKRLKIIFMFIPSENENASQQKYKPISNKTLTISLLLVQMYLHWFKSNLPHNVYSKYSFIWNI